MGRKVADRLILAVGALVGGGVYLGLARLLRVEELSLAWGLLGRRAGR